jgi:hypothetical protein
MLLPDLYIVACVLSMTDKLMGGLNVVKLGFFGLACLALCWRERRLHALLFAIACLERL